MQLIQNQICVLARITNTTHWYSTSLRGTVNNHVSDANQPLANRCGCRHVLNIAQRNVANRLGQQAVFDLDLAARQRVSHAIALDVAVKWKAEECQRADEHR